MSETNYSFFLLNTFLTHYFFFEIHINLIKQSNSLLTKKKGKTDMI